MLCGISHVMTCYHMPMRASSADSNWFPKIATPPSCHTMPMAMDFSLQNDSHLDTVASSACSFAALLLYVVFHFARQHPSMVVDASLFLCLTHALFCLRQSYAVYRSYANTGKLVFNQVATVLPLAVQSIAQFDSCYFRWTRL